MERAPIAGGTPPSAPLFRYAAEPNPNIAALVAAIAAISAVGSCIVMLLAGLGSDQAPDWGWISASLVLCAAVAVVVSREVRELVRTEGIVTPPVPRTMIYLALMMATATAFGYGSHAPLPYLAMTLMFVLVVTAIIGKAAVILVEYAVAATLLAAVAVARDADGASLMNTLVTCAVAWLVAISSTKILASYSLRGVERVEHLGEAARIAASANSLEEGLARFLPLLATESAAGRIDAYLVSPPTFDDARPIAHHTAERAGGGRDEPAAAVPWQASYLTDLDPHSTHERSRDLGDVALTWAPMPSGERLVIVASELETTRLLALSRRAARTYTLDGFSVQLELLGTRAGYIASLAELSRTDGLTGLANRRALDERLAQELIAAARFERTVSVAMVDLDHFKQYNDEHGHIAGDDALRGFADRLTDATRAIDVVARYGGEEFCLVLPGTTVAGAVTLLDGLREGRRGTSADHGPQANGSVITFSAGVAEWDRGEDPEALLERADVALYAAKREGRDRTSIATVHQR